MTYITNFDQSNRADWIVQISATDADTGDDIDFTDAEVSFVVKDDGDCVKLCATVGDGITLVSPAVLQVQFTPDQMQGLCPGSYKVGAVYKISGETDQLFVGTVSVYDGIAKL